VLVTGSGCEVLTVSQGAPQRGTGVGELPL
jgi:hypothetical protein